MGARAAMNAEKELVNVELIAEEAARIYAEKYQEEYEKEYSGWFAVIDVNTGDIYIGEYSDDAFESAKQENADGPLHLIRIGCQGAFRMGYLGSLNA